MLPLTGLFPYQVRVFKWTLLSVSLFANEISVMYFL